MRTPINFSVTDLKNKTLQHQKSSAAKVRTSSWQVFTGQRGGKYTIAKRSDGTLYRRYF